MPSLRHCNRAWAFAGDDLAVPACCAVTTRFGWSLLLCLVLALAAHAIRRCHGFWLVFLFLALSLLEHVLAMVLESFMLAEAMRGTIVQAEKRQRLPTLLTAHSVLAVTQLFVAVLGVCIIASADLVSCAESDEIALQPVKVVLGVVVATQLADVFGQMCCGVSLMGRRIVRRRRRRGGYEGGQEHDDDVHEDDEMDDEEDDHNALHLHDADGDPFEEDVRLLADSTQQRMHMTWENRCRLLCQCLQCATCSLFGGADTSTQDLQMVARVLVHVFRHDGVLDVVPSDIVAGIVLLRHEQRQRERERLRLDASRNNVASGATPAITAAPRPLKPGAEATPAVTGSIGVPLSLANPEHARLVCEGTRYSRHALAIYTWMIQVYMNPLSSGRLCCTPCCLMPRRTRTRQALLYGAVDTDDMGSGAAQDDHRDDGNGAPASGGDRDQGFRLTRALRGWWLGEQHGRVAAGAGNGNSEDARTGATPSLHARGPSQRPMSTSSPPPVLEASRVSGDNDCRLHEAAFVQISGLQEADVAYANFSNNLQEKPYAIVVDHKFRSIVITIRGTLSLEDCITDATALPCRIEDKGAQWCDTTGWAHAGILDAACWIRGDIEERRVLASTLLAWPEYESSLVVCGHSLGAGTAVLLTMFLRRDFPQVRCFAYGIPGGLVDLPNAEACKEFVTTFVLGNDLVPRLTFGSLEATRDRVLELIARCKVNKNRVISSLVSTRDDILDTLLYGEDEIPQSEFLDRLQRHRRLVSSEGALAGHEPLYPAGQLVHIRKVGSHPASCCGTIPEYSYEFIDHSALHQLRVSTTMVTDHFPDKYAERMEQTTQAGGWAMLS